MNDLAGAVVIVEDDEFEHSSVCIEPQDKYTLWMIVVEWGGQKWGMCRSEDVGIDHAVLVSGSANDHEAAAHWANARRIASDLSRCSRSARSMTA